MAGHKTHTANNKTAMKTPMAKAKIPIITTIDLSKKPTSLKIVLTTKTEKILPRSIPGFFFSDILLHGENKVVSNNFIEKKSSTAPK